MKGIIVGTLAVVALVAAVAVVATRTVTDAIDTGSARPA